MEGSSHSLIGGSSEHFFGGTEKNETHGRRVAVSAEIRTGTSSIQITNLTVDVFHIPCISSMYSELQLRRLYYCSVIWIIIHLVYFCAHLSTYAKQQFLNF